MVNKRSMGGMVAAFSLLLAFPALSSAHTVSVSVGRSQCVTPLSGQYTATVTITEAYFSGTVENIPAGQNVHELSTSTGKGNSGLNQNYFTTGAMGTQTGPVNLGQPTSFTSPASGDTAALHFTVTTSVPETYVLQNSYMHSPATGTITAPASGCTPPPSCPSGQTLVNGVCVPPTGCPAGQTLTAGKCQPSTSCPTGQILSGGQCTPLTSCPAGTTMTGSVCAKATVVLPPAKIYPGVCQASTRGYTVRAGQEDTIIVSVHRHGAAVAGAKVRITLPGGQVVSRTTGRNGKATFTVAPAQSGTIFVRSPSCKEMVRVKVYAAKASTVVRAPSFTG
jgi:hypothetical protein